MWTKVVISYWEIYRKILSGQTEQNHGNLTTTTEHEGHLKEATLKNHSRLTPLQQAAFRLIIRLHWRTNFY
jgi:hypothetical protein